mgnify:FL=1
MSVGSRLAEFATRRRHFVTWTTVGITLLLVLGAALPSLFPRRFAFLHPIEVDTDPENMLAEDEPVRVFHDRMKEVFDLNDMVVVGVVNEEGIFNPDSLERVHALTEFAMKLQWRRFDQPHRTEGVIRPDVLAPSTVDRSTPTAGAISFSWLMPQPPKTQAEANQILAEALRIPLLRDTLVSLDGQAVAVYLPLSRKSLSYRVYSALNRQTPILWQWGPVAGEIRRLELPDSGEPTRRALLRAGQLMAERAEDADTFRSELETLVRLAASGDANATLGSVAEYLRNSFTDQARQIDAPRRARLDEVARELQQMDLPAKRREQLTAEQNRLRASSAREFVGRATAEMREHIRAGKTPELTLLALWRLEALAESNQSAEGLVEATASFIEQLRADLAGAKKTMEWAGTKEALKGTGWGDRNPDEVRVIAQSEDATSVVQLRIEEALDRAAASAEADRYHITGLPVAEDTFGVEMFIQMAISAPAAMAVIFILMMLFFRKLVIVVSPMIVAMISVAFTMGSLIIAGFPVHIMSSMIPIFIMPIAVLDSIHIISDFFERYQATRDRRKTITAVMDDLFGPMLYTSLTSAAGFASLALTPIPPVQVFGVFVGLGILAAWFVTVTFIPAFLMFIPAGSLENFGAKHTADEDAAAAHKPLTRFLRFVGGATYRRAKMIVALAAVVLVLAGVGISKININDNPVMWFEPDHPIRQADRVLNAHFGGTYMAYLSVDYRPDAFDADDYAADLAGRLDALAADVTASADRLAEVAGNQADAADRWGFIAAVERQARPNPMTATDRELMVWKIIRGYFESQYDAEDDEPFNAAGYGQQFAAGLKAYAAAAGRNLRQLGDRAGAIAAADRTAFLDALSEPAAAAAATAPAEGPAGEVVENVLAVERQREEVFKDPAVLAHLDELRRVMHEASLEGRSVVGKVNSLSEIVKTVYRDLLASEADYGPPREDPNYKLPPNRDGVAQSLLQFQNSHRRGDLDHFRTPDFQNTSLWVQLTSGDNRDMSAVARTVRQYTYAVELRRRLGAERWQAFRDRASLGGGALRAYLDAELGGAEVQKRSTGEAEAGPQSLLSELRDLSPKQLQAVADFEVNVVPPVPLGHRWFGLTYINVVWQDKMVTGMLGALAGSFLVVFLLMTFLFRSALWGLLSMIPLTVTIAAIYGAIGFIGKDYDMPVAVLSSLTLGLAVDFAIHFLARGRAMYAKYGSWAQTAPHVFGEPARAITRNIIVIAAGFLPLLLAPLMPYKTVGVLLATILLVSGVGTLLLLSALVRLLEKLLFPTRPLLGLTCNCMTCLISAAALAGLVVLNVHQYLDAGWNVTALIAGAIVLVMAGACWLSSRRAACNVNPTSDSEGDANHDTQPKD